MRPQAEFDAVQELIRSGMNDCAIARVTGIPRPTVRDWRSKVRNERIDPHCPICSRAPLDQAAYAYLLGLYLGDGCLSEHPRGVFKLRIALDLRYLGIIDECARAIAAVRGRNRCGFRENIGCIEVYSFWKHWPCLFPQHGPGLKHRRKIELEPWQEEIIGRHPEHLLRGLIHSDGCRSLNRVNGTGYPRYYFTNASEDIRRIFCNACDRYGVAWRQMNQRNISVARAPDVLKLDLVIGPKA
ncbi:MAG: helix-turn-helix domain-containing protein [Actinomycetota bacterium]|nr:helix-turn-helix domain-containing protein [Actinomycetota bacterium]